MQNAYRAGHVAVIGRPNVGKSTLTNALVGAKISIVSPRPQTTRHRLLGIATFPEGQLVLVVNQVDRLKDKTALLPYLAQVSEGRDFAGVHPVSALKRNGLEALVKTVLQHLPEQDALYGEDEITDKSQRFLAGEMVREQLMRQLGEELPYATTVEIERFEVDGRLLRIGAVIWVERDGQKAIVIGKGGERLREIGAKARQQMERLFDSKVFLETWVRVREGWSDDEAALRAFGYHD